MEGRVEVSEMPTHRCPWCSSKHYKAHKLIEHIVKNHRDKGKEEIISFINELRAKFDLPPLELEETQNKRLE